MLLENYLLSILRLKVNEGQALSYMAPTVKRGGQKNSCIFWYKKGLEPLSVSMKLDNWKLGYDLQI